MSDPLLDIRDLHLTMTSFDGEAHVLNGINLTVRRREIWGLVGETGCGKSLTGLSVSRLVTSPPARYKSGQILFDGRNLLAVPESEMRALRGRRIGMIFQDPTTNLNPVFRIGEQLIDVALSSAQHSPEILGLSSNASRSERKAAAWRLAAEMLDKVGIPDAAGRLNDYPHQFSGGMRQRVLIAMTLIGQPDLLIADEPTTALDVSVQAQVLELFTGMVRDNDMAVVLITHNLGVVSQTCTHVAVMYAGNIVESGPVARVIAEPAHPYTQALLAAIPSRTMRRGDLQGLAGSVPNLIAPPSGCRFAPRCARAISACTERVPPAIELGAGHSAACIRLDEGRGAA